MTDVWQPSTVYAPGATVTPTTGSGQTVTTAAPTNANFDTDLTGWTVDTTGFTWSGTEGYGALGSAEFAAGAGDGLFLVNDNHVPVVVGQHIAATIMVQQGHSDAGDAGGGVAVFWFDEDDNFLNGTADLSRDTGNIVDSSEGGWWKRSSVNAVAPTGAVTAAIGIAAFNHGSDPCYFDMAAWDYAYTAPAQQRIFTAVQTDPGHSGATEPVWSTDPTALITDNEVIWQGGSVDRITWECSPIMKSGDTEPAFPTAVGGTVLDNTVNWTCITPQITDPNCPDSPIVAVGASKVFVADNDIVRFSATSNPLDWTSDNDAGFLPFGLQNFGANPAAAMNLYRSNLVVFNTEGLQMWQIDEDPANMALLDAVPVGSTQQRAMSPVSNDLFFLSPLGVRTIGISAASQNLQAGDIGMPIDPLVQQAIADAIAAETTPLATYYPAAGQYWLAFPGDTLDAFFLTSRPYPIDATEAYTGSTDIRDERVIGTPAEAVEVLFGLTSGSLADKLHSYSADPEAYEAAFEIASGELRDILHSYSADPEAYEVAFSLGSGELRDALVSTDMLPEALDAAFSLVSGSLA